MNLTLKPLFDTTDDFYNRFQKYQKFDIKKDGVVIGHLEWKHRPKNAGGHAWNACINGTVIPRALSGSVHSYWNKDKDKLLANVRAILEGREPEFHEPLEPVLRTRYY